MDAVIYARVSSREQQQEGFSIQSQQRSCRAYATKNGFRITREFIDVESAKQSGRKHFGEMVDFLKRTKNPVCLLVEKMDRLCRNFDDLGLLEKLGTEIHFVKTGTVHSKNAKAQTKFMHGIEVVSAKFYSDNLREEVIKGMREKAEQGIYPGRAPFGYRNNQILRTIEVHSENSEIVKFAFEQYATGGFSLITLRNAIRERFGKTVNRSYLHTILTNPVYTGVFEWAGRTYTGSHPTLISSNLFESVQAVIRGFNKGKYRKVDIAFRGMLTCAHDDCTVTAELKKNKYVYYRCSGGRGKCDLPRFREQEISDKLGTLLKDIYVPDDVVAKITAALEQDEQNSKAEIERQRQRLATQKTLIHERMDKAYADKLDGKIPEEFWQRKMADWQTEERRIIDAEAGLTTPAAERTLNAKRILELANKAHFLYVTRKPHEQAELLKKVLLNCSIDGVSLYPTYRKPFDVIFERAKSNEWSGRADLNCRPLAPQASALPG
ncbi:Recombinase [Candidatus Koribacter versatilis Ellin345]|uniref:Recombinase n=1 Tax=Koribacter versatilis (strain Ellin345) TaxID=204669 RepID=Q1IJI7_KORVE|nr:Recombinase [Candidatus Koribacter versatilis Ellin345]